MSNRWRLWSTGRRLDDIEDVLAKLTDYGENIMADLTKLRDAVTRIEDQERAMVTLFTGLADQLRAANSNNDQDAIDAIAAELSGEADKIAAAVAANTPAAPAPPADPAAPAAPSP